MRGDKLVRFIQELLEPLEESWTEELRNDLPHSYQCHGDLFLLAENCFSLPVWKKIGNVVLIFLNYCYIKSTRLQSC